ncbi:zinc-dependent peptidase [Gaetbulibacter sp. M240]|uniref:zinc-dependent peptidase n=1 Tax=Gaetbulibacter sp. M240 TaxID=3126511 RepID=UPI00374F553E
MLFFGFRLFERIYSLIYKRPLFVHWYFKLRTISSEQRQILKDQFLFYNKLSKREQRYFEHRLATFLKSKKFLGRDGISVDGHVQVLISATAVMLTFGFRDYLIGAVSTIIIYPETFYSQIKQEYHKGEFNPFFSALALSWKDFKKGYAIDNDNLNLGIHEFAHAIHYNSNTESDISSIIFRESINELLHLLSKDKDLREALINSQYLRSYAFTNPFEFLAVLIENFIETPHVFKDQFPQIYIKVKQMLNFNMRGY